MSPTKYTEKPDVGIRLVAVRKRLGLRQIDVARELGVCRATISKIEGEYSASNAVCRKLEAWLEAKEAEIAALDAAAAVDKARPKRPTPRVPVHVRLAMLRMLGRTQREE